MALTRKRPEDGIHQVEPGDTISSIAALYGFSDWEARVYNAPENAQLKLARPNPNTLAPGDEVFVPELQEKLEARPTDAWHDFHVPNSKRFVRLKLRNADDTPLKHEPYRIEAKGGFRGTFVQQGEATSEEGIIEERVPYSLVDADLVLPNRNMTVRLRIAHLLPLPMQEPVKNEGAGALGGVLGDALGELGGVGDVAGALSGAASGSFSAGGNGVSFGGGADAGADLASGMAEKAASTASAAASAVAGALGLGAFGEDENPNIYSAAQRLESMGFKPGEPRDNQRTAEFSAALMAFQTWCKQQGNLADSAGGPLGSLTSPGGVLGGGGGPLGDIAAGVAGPMLAAVGLTGQLDEPTIEALKTTHGS